MLASLQAKAKEKAGVSVVVKEDEDDGDDEPESPTGSNTIGVLEGSRRAGFMQKQLCFSMCVDLGMAGVRGKIPQFRNKT